MTRRVFLMDLVIAALVPWVVRKLRAGYSPAYPGRVVPLSDVAKVGKWLG